MALKRVSEIVRFHACRPLQTYCGYCRGVKELLTQVGAFYKAIDLDVERDGDLMRAALAEWTGQGTVPNVFVVGSFDDVFWKYQEGTMTALLVDAGAIVNNTSQQNEGKNGR